MWWMPVDLAVPWVVVLCASFCERNGTFGAALLTLLVLQGLLGFNKASALAI